MCGECKYKRNLDTDRKVFRVCPNIAEDKIKGYPKIKHSNWMIFLDTDLTKILTGQYFSYTSTKDTQCLSVQTAEDTQAKDTEDTAVTQDLKNKTVTSNSHRSIHLSLHPQFAKYLKIFKFWTICCNHPRSLTRWLFLSVMHPKDAEGIANSVDPDKTAQKSDLGLHCLPRSVCHDSFKTA